MTGTRYTVEVNPRLPERLGRLRELADDLYYGWDRHSRGLFFYIDRDLWEACGHNPRLFLRRVDQQRLEAAAGDRAFLEAYHRTLANYDTYLDDRTPTGAVAELDPAVDLVAYFCAEFGLHESLPVYSGGLGILAGDFCKAASDIRLPFVAVGLLYRQGIPAQTLDQGGHQVMHYLPGDIEDLPLAPARTPGGEEIEIEVELPEGPLAVRVWQAHAGHIHLYLLDTEVARNREGDRAVTHQLYPADKAMRLKQEMVLGIAGVRALRALGLAPTIWHINEGHPSLQLLERMRELVAAGLPFAAALEQVAAATVFTTHTPVPAGHEIFDVALLRSHLRAMIAELGVGEEQFLQLGRNGQSEGFNLTTFALRASRFHNGVSRIHGDTAARMEQHVWPEVPVRENPMRHVTNGIHVPTFIARGWINVLDDPGWGNELRNPQYWQERVGDMAVTTFWSVHLALKRLLIEEIRRRIAARCRRFGFSQAQIDRETAVLDAHEDVLLIGFARRFATYKRATLLFEDPDRLARLLGDEQRPVCLVFAGRAHPSDVPGQELIRRIHEYTHQPRFHGRVILLEGYDLALARKMVTGADLWVNVPEYPLEASGTSGMKAAINGALNLSIMDGWWAEGFDGRNGWGLQPHHSEGDPERRRWLEAKELLDTLEHEVIPLYFDQVQGCPRDWVDMAKASMTSVIPRFSAQRMLMDYLEGFYLPARAVAGRLEAEAGRGARTLAEWKARVRVRWPGVRVRRLDEPPRRIADGERLPVAVGVALNGLSPEDVTVQCLIGRCDDAEAFIEHTRVALTAAGTGDGEARFELDLDPDLSGLIAYQLRAFPSHPLLCHPFEMGLMKWL